MAFDFTTAIDYTTTIAMTRTLSLLVKTRSDTDILAALQNHAVPRVAGYLMTAQDTAGNYLFYSALGDLADDVLAEKAEQLVTAVMSEPMVAGYIRRIAAAFACGWLLVGDAGSFIDSQQKLASTLENQALADLKHLIKSEIINKSIQSALPKVQAPQLAKMYFALDIDPTSVSNGEGKPFIGAQDSGTATAIINGFSVQISVDLGDTPVLIMSKLSTAINGAMGTGNVNITAGANEGAQKSYSTTVSSVDIFGVAQTSSATYRTNIGSLDIYPYKYDKIVDVAVVTIELLDSLGELGIPGIVYGTDPANMSRKGPYTMAVDLDTGKTTALDDPNKAIVSDMLFFEMDNPDFGTLSDEILTYRINAGTTQTVDIPANTSLHKIVEILAQDLADKSLDQRVLGAIRPATKITINGSPATAPGLSFVSIGVDKLLAKYVFTLVSSPPGVRFGVVPSTLVTSVNFDEFSKSVVINTTVGSSGTFTQTGPDGESALRSGGSAMYSEHKNSKKLQAILDQLDSMDGSI